jgi:predicted SAM-dependent methyltransferase
VALRAEDRRFRDMNLHLGCGDRRLAGFEHIDARADCNPDHIADVLALPFEDNSAGLIYFSHGRTTAPG